MLDLNVIREKPEIVRTALRNRQMDASSIDTILRLDEKRRALLTEVEQLKAERNAASKEIGRMKDAAGRETKIAAMREVGDRKGDHNNSQCARQVLGCLQRYLEQSHRLLQSFGEKHNPVYRELPHTSVDDDVISPKASTVSQLSLLLP